MSISNRDYMRDPNGGFSGFVKGWRAVEVIIAINVAVFLGWALVAHPHSPNPSSVFTDHFVVGINTLKSGKVWTLITSVFSHNELWHLLMNMFILWSFGRVVEEELGTRRFIIMYLVAGVVASLAHSGLSLVGLPPKNALGASGSIAAVVLLFCLSHPRQTLLLMFVIPVPAYMLAVFFVGYDVVGLVMQFNGTPWGNVGHGAHLGGALCGYLYFLHLRGQIRLPLPSLGGGGSRRKRRRRRTADHDAQVRATVPPRSDSDEHRMDELLRKVKTGGLDSLSAEEREWMIRQSKHYRDQ